MKMAKKLAVVAIGGNSLILDPKNVTVEDQYLAAAETTRHIADMIEAGWDVAIGHGNGPQVGFILRRSEIAAKVEGMHEVPLDVCGADSQGAIGYALQQTLQNELNKRGIKKPVATVVTQVKVDKNDKAFQNPTKPIGGFMEEAEAKKRQHDLGWNVVEDSGRGWRRVVAAVIDKDFASSLLARLIKADLFVISTAVEKVAINFGKPDQKWLDKITLAEAKAYLAEGIHFAKGSMAPKIQAVIMYLENGGKEALITNPENIGRALRGETGTRIVKE